MPDARSKVQVLVEVNAGIREFAVASSTSETEWEFFCECGDPACHAVVLLTVEAYGAIRDGGRGILATAHAPSPQTRAKALREDAKALRAQAAHQLKRARRNLERKD